MKVLYLMQCFLFSCLAAMCFSGAAMAQVEGHGRNAPERGELVVATLEFKGPGYVSIRDISWSVDDETEIIDAQGQPITLSALPIPCEAKVALEYRTNNNPLVKMIQVIKVLSGATATWP